MSEKLTGGPAFPVSVGGPEGHQDSPISWQYPGMTLRDYFAAAADISADRDADGCINARLAYNLMDGIKVPSWDDDYLNARIYWAEAEARLRYMKADAMISERNK